MNSIEREINMNKYEDDRFFKVPQEEVEITYLKYFESDINK